MVNVNNVLLQSLLNCLYLVRNVLIGIINCYLQQKVVWSLGLNHMPFILEYGHMTIWLLPNGQKNAIMGSYVESTNIFLTCEGT